MNPSIDPARMDRMMAVTSQFNGLRGLMVVPVGIALAVSGAGHFAGLSEWTLPVLALGLLAMIPTSAYYRRRYGSVRRSSAVEGTVLVAVVLALFIGFGIGVTLLDLQDGPLWLAGVQIGLVLVVVGLYGCAARRKWRDARITRHYAVMGAVLTAAGLFPLGLFTGGTHPLNASDGLQNGSPVFALGICFIIGGLLDHRTLDRALAAVSGRGAGAGGDAGPNGQGHP